MPTRFTLGQTLLAAIMLTASCRGMLGIDDWEPKPTDGAPCTLNTDCPESLVCVFAHCSVACRDDRDCQEDGRRCLTLPDGASGCVSPEQAACQNGTCQGGTECRDGVCRTPCASGCRDDQSCEDGVCVGFNEPGTSAEGGAGGTAGTAGRGGGGSSGAAGRGGAGAGGLQGDGGAAASGASDPGGSGGDTVAGGSSGKGGTGGSGGDAGAGDSGMGGSSGTSGTGGKGGDAGSAGSSTDPCVGVACDDPPANTCVNDDKRTYDAMGSCIDGDCSYGHTDTPCDFGCDAGECNPDPCAGVTCTSPPGNTCTDSGHLKAYDSPGSCSDGDCSYSSHAVLCTCVNDECTTDPCASVSCDNPPSPICNNGDRRNYNSSGSCSGGSCSYGYIDTPCQFGCTSGACNPDPCNGVACTSPPAASCPTGMLLRTFDAVGTCSNGICSYDHADTNCTQACVFSPGAMCKCNTGYSGSGIGSSGCTDDDECTLNTDDCDNSPVAVCNNKPGSWDCSCPSPYSGDGHGTNGCTCPTVTACDAANEMNGSYCSNSTTRVACSDNNGCQQAQSGSCQNVANEKCVGSYPDAKCELAFGFPGDAGNSSTLGAAFLMAQPFAISQQVTVSRFGLISRATTSGVRMGVYTDSAGTIGTFKASALGTVSTGRNEYPVDDPPPTTPVVLAPGNYWIVVVLQADTSLAQHSSSGNVRYKTWSPWNTALSSTPIGSTTPDSFTRLSLYLVGKP